MHQLLSNFFRWLATTHRGRRRFPCSGSGNILPGLHVSVNHVPSDAAGYNSEWTQNEEGNEPDIVRFAASRCIVLKRRFSSRAVEALRPSWFGKRISRAIAALISSSSWIPPSLAFLALRNMSILIFIKRILPSIPGWISASCTHFARISSCPGSTMSSTMRSTFWEIQQHDKNHVKSGNQFHLNSVMPISKTLKLQLTREDLSRNQCDHSRSVIGFERDDLLNSTSDSQTSG